MKTLKTLLGSWYEPLEDLHEEINRLRTLMGTKLHTPDAFLECFRRTPYDKCHTVFMGITPYPDVTNYGLQKATGVALEHRDVFGLSTPLREFFTEIENCTGENVRRVKSLNYLCEQGVLLTNSSLTTAPGQANAHQKEWREFTKNFVRILSSQKPVYFVFMGKDTHKYSKFVYTSLYNSLYSNVAFPLSYIEKESKFINSGIFKEVDRYHSWMNIPNIEWSKDKWEEKKALKESETNKQVLSSKETSPNGSEISSDSPSSKSQPQDLSQKPSTQEK